LHIALWAAFGGYAECEDAPAALVEQVALMLQARNQVERADLENRKAELEARQAEMAREQDVKARAAQQFGRMG